MHLTQDEINLILKDFPNVELSYDSISHKNVPKFFAWFTSYKEDHICLLLEILANRQFGKIESIVTSFDDRLAYGTIFYGSIFHYNRNKCFLIEDIMYCYGKKTQQIKYNEKLELMLRIFENDLNQIALNDDFVIFGPFMKPPLPPKPTNNGPRMINNRQNPAAPVVNNRPKIVNNGQNPTNTAQKWEDPMRVFKITPDAQNDIYHLYTEEYGKHEYFDVAYIPDYTTSKMMNNLFRNIKENANLDALEESDDEEEFESEQPNKFVFLDKTYNMKCKFHAKFKKWIPVSLAASDHKISSKTQLPSRFLSV